MADISGYLTNIKNAERGEDVRDSIIAALNKINNDNPANIQPLSVSANGTYSGENGVVYNPVTVNVPEGASQALTLKTIEITENGETEADDGEAFMKVIVDVPQYENEIMDEITITANGDYEALLDGYDGYGVVHVNVQLTPSGTFTVDFMSVDGTSIAQRYEVAAGGGATWKGTAPVSSGMRFVGWNPNPTNVQGNMVCYPKFESISYTVGEITDTWSEIIKNINAGNKDKYSIGQWKMISFADTYYATRMQLVGKGVDPLAGNKGYAETTWLAMNPIYWQRSYTEDTWPLDTTPLTTNTFIYLNDEVRTLLNTCIYSKVGDDIKKYIKEVVKYTYTQMPSGQYSQAYPTNELLWRPSVGEFVGDSCVDFSDSWRHFLPETLGPQYPIARDEETGIYSPTVFISEGRNIYYGAGNYYNTAFRSYSGWADDRGNEAIINVDGTLNGDGVRGVPFTGVSVLFGFCI